MDQLARGILVLLLERLKQFEKARLQDLTAMNALILTLRAMSPQADNFFMERMRDSETRQAQDPRLDTTGTYDELIRLLKSPDQTAEDEQDKLRRILEAFEGPLQ